METKLLGNSDRVRFDALSSGDCFTLGSPRIYMKVLWVPNGYIALDNCAYFTMHDLAFLVHTVEQVSPVEFRRK